MTIVSSDAKAEIVLANKAFAKMPNEVAPTLFYGVELEVESDGKKMSKAGYTDMYTMQTKLSDLCDTDFDGYAITKMEGLEFGFEIVTVPATLEAHKNLIWGKFFGNTSQYLKSSGGTGMHIHFSRAGVTDQQLAKALYFMHDTPNRQFLTKIAGRPVHPGANWCRTNKKDVSLLTHTSGRESIILSETGVIRGALCVSTRNNGKTVEMRIFRANVSYRGVMQGLEFVDALLKYTNIAGNTEKDLHSDAFIEWYLDSKQDVLYPHLTTNMADLELIHKPPLTIDSIKEIVNGFLNKKVA